MKGKEQIMMRSKPLHLSDVVGVCDGRAFMAARSLVFIDELTADAEEFTEWLFTY